MKLALKHSESHWVDISEGVKFLIDYPTREQEQELQSITFGSKFTGTDVNLKYTQKYVKFTVKDWQGVTDSEGKEIKCVLKDNELDDELWWALAGDPTQALKIFAKIYKETEFTETDKKK